MVQSGRHPHRRGYRGNSACAVCCHLLPSHCYFLSCMAIPCIYACFFMCGKWCLTKRKAKTLTLIHIYNTYTPRHMHIHAYEQHVYICTHASISPSIPFCHLCVCLFIISLTWTSFIPFSILHLFSFFSFIFLSYSFLHLLPLIFLSHFHSHSSIVSLSFSPSSSLSFILFLEGLWPQSRDPHSNIQAVYPHHTRSRRSEQATFTHPYRSVSQSASQSVSQSVMLLLTCMTDIHCCSYNPIAVTPYYSMTLDTIWLKRISHDLCKKDNSEPDEECSEWC